MKGQTDVYLDKQKYGQTERYGQIDKQTDKQKRALSQMNKQKGKQTYGYANRQWTTRWMKVQTD